MLAITRPSAPIVVLQHVEDAASLRRTRSVLVRAPHVSLPLLRRLDDRLAASLDGIDVAGDAGRDLCVAALAAPGRGAVFAASVCAIERRDPAWLDRLLALAEAEPEARIGVVPAFGWVSAASLRGISAALLRSGLPFRRALGLEACALHGVDPAGALDAALADPDAQAHAIGIAGRLGRIDLLPRCMEGLSVEDADARYRAACACMRLGDRHASVQVLARFAAAAGPFQAGAAALLLKWLEPAQCRSWLQAMARDPAAIRLLVRGIGWIGDARHAPWLIGQMGDAALARLAGEAFSTMTGARIAADSLDLPPPATIGADPTDDPDDANVAMDEDDSLPWPHPAKVAEWWDAQQHRFTLGTRYFMGAVPSTVHCLDVLAHGLQRQRAAAADHLVLSGPGRPVFNTAAPAWRQARRLSAMGA